MDCKTQKNKIRPEEEKKALIIRMNKIIGQMNGIKKMIETDRYCDEVLTQLSAVDRSIKSLADIVLEEHMHSCLIANIQNGDFTIVDEILDIFKKFR